MNAMLCCCVYCCSHFTVAFSDFIASGPCNCSRISFFMKYVRWRLCRQFCGRRRGSLPLLRLLRCGGAAERVFAGRVVQCVVMIRTCSLCNVNIFKTAIRQRGGIVFKNSCPLVKMTSRPVIVCGAVIVTLIIIVFCNQYCGQPTHAYARNEHSDISDAQRLNSKSDVIKVAEAKVSCGVCERFW